MLQDSSISRSYPKSRNTEIYSCTWYTYSTTTSACALHSRTHQAADEASRHRRQSQRDIEILAQLHPLHIPHHYTDSPKPVPKPRPAPSADTSTVPAGAWFLVEALLELTPITALCQVGPEQGGIDAAQVVLCDVGLENPRLYEEDVAELADELEAFVERFDAKAVNDILI